MRLYGTFGVLVAIMVAAVDVLVLGFLLGIGKYLKPLRFYLGCHFPGEPINFVHMKFSKS